jgi:hypothetical protein
MDARPFEVGPAMKRALVCVAAASLASPAAAQPPRVPVPLIAAQGYGPCSTAIVRGLDGAGAFLAVRSGPSARHRELARLGNGAEVFACVRHGNWFGIVFAPASGRRDCGVDQPRRVNAYYSGPCRSGWVYERYLGGYADWVSP